MKKLFAWLWLIAVYSSIFAPFSLISAQKTSGKTNSINSMNMIESLPNGLQFRLSEGTVGAETREKQPVAETNPLSEKETGNLLKRIPAIKPDANDQT
ncbi:MAG TPA: hypothetical protein VGD05_03200, partial [Pyrinomonadaceae bacterium]